MTNSTNEHGPQPSDAEIFQVIRDLDTLHRADQSYTLAFEQAQRDAWAQYHEDHSSQTVGASLYAGELATIAAKVLGVDYERCVTVAKEVTIAETRWTIRSELHRLADMARKGIPIYDKTAAPIADAADARHAELDEEQRAENERRLAEWEAEYPQMAGSSYEEKVAFVEMMADFRETFGAREPEIPASARLAQQRNARRRQ